MRFTLAIPLLLAAIVSCAYAAMYWSGADLKPQHMLIATGAALLASEAAMVPLLLTRGGSSIGMAQAGLVATSLHLFIFIAAAAIGLMQFKAGASLAYWLFGLYCPTLILVVAACVLAVRAAPSTDVQTLRD